MKPSPFYNRMVDVMEELVKFTLLTRGRSAYLVDRYSERVESAEALSLRVNQRSISIGVSVSLYGAGVFAARRVVVLDGEIECADQFRKVRPDERHGLHGPVIQGLLRRDHEQAGF
jgi:hypothetical protein